MPESSDRVEITIRVPQEALDAISSILGSDHGPTNGKDSCGRLAELAFEQFYGWLSGAKRYRTLTEQYIDWVESIYKELLPPQERPTIERLYGKFNIPHGQATYICRVLNDKALSHWRLRALQELKTALEDKSAKAKEMIGKGEKEKPLILRISSLASIELRNMTVAMFEGDRSVLVPKIESSYGDIRTVSIPAQTLERVLSQLISQ